MYAAFPGWRRALHALQLLGDGAASGLDADAPGTSDARARGTADDQRHPLHHGLIYRSVSVAAAGVTAAATAAAVS